MFDRHQIRISTKLPYARYCISFDSSLLLFASSESSNLFNIFSHCTDVTWSKPLTPEQVASFIAIYEKHEKLHFENGNDTMEKALILEIFAHVYNLFYNGQTISATDSTGLATVTELLNYIDTNIAKDLSLENLAKHAAYSTFHLERIFKRYTNTTLKNTSSTKG